MNRRQSLCVETRSAYFRWRSADRKDLVEYDGFLSFHDIRRYVQQLTEPGAYVLIRMPFSSVDLTVQNDGTIELEIMDSSEGRNHFARVDLALTETIVERAIDHWNDNDLYTVLSKLPVSWIM